MRFLPACRLFSLLALSLLGPLVALAQDKATDAGAGAQRDHTGRRDLHLRRAQTDWAGSSAKACQVSLLKANGSTAALQAVASGSADVAYASSLNIAAAVDKGVPVKAFAGITVQWPYFIGVPPGSAIQDHCRSEGQARGRDQPGFRLLRRPEGQPQDCRTEGK
jgi:ABC-type nitrate/sulfonate/bicarbonate transport system substrate-binding protein